MNKVLDSTDSVARRRHDDYERYLAYENIEQQRLETDEITEASEKLVLPMNNRFEYQLGPDGELWFQGQALGPILDKSIEEAKLVAQHYPQFAVELARRQIERQEYDQQCRLALSGDDTSDVLVVLSPIPDAAVRGVNLGAYDLERKVTMARIYQRSEAGIEATSLSLDLSDGDGLQSIVKRFGQSIPEGASSEEILAMRLWSSSDELGGKSASQVVREAYDQTLADKFGGQWYAGRQEDPVIDAMGFIREQPDLIAEHLTVMKAIQTETDRPTRQRLAKQARYNFAAAVDRRLKGRSDVSGADGSVLGGAGDEAAASGVEYRSNCADGQGLTTESALAEMGMTDQFVKETFFVRQCPICGATNVMAEKDGGIIRGLDCGCWSDVCTGEFGRGDKLRKQQTSASQPAAVMAAATRSERSASVAKLNQADRLRIQFGQYATLKSTIVLGGTRDEVVDARTGETIATSDDLRRI